MACPPQLRTLILRQDRFIISCDSCKLNIAEPGTVGDKGSVPPYPPIIRTDLAPDNGRGGEGGRG
ncbi:hypothetical protein GGP41_009550 [Bipolaris sorokiniana]|uniref:Uncharacterized protein n=1 Tax=Cochliobolus sativus TaxID=45130 RepID=A0A8H5ZBY1_COCSA|nr:hypothetical protein GGP41_009550 [Bipolaris sorokiniana]